jgi:predicted nucleic acid-binding protein
MKYVIDSSTAVKWVLPEIDSDKADALRIHFRNGVHELQAPDIFTVEAAHALTRAERQGWVSVGDARKLLLDILTTPPKLIPIMPFLLRAVDISSAMRTGVYDCVYVALAEREKCEFVTADDKLVKNLQAQFPFVQHLSVFP